MSENIFQINEIKENVLWKFYFYIFDYYMIILVI